MADRPMDMDGRVALVTGGVEGIGWATSKHLAGRGAHVIVSGRADDERLMARVEELTNVGLSASGLQCDVADGRSVQSAAQEIFKVHRRLDILVANAGILQDAALGMITEDSLNVTMQTNLMGCIRVIQIAARLMTRAGSGSIVAVSSIIGTNGNVGQVAYGGSKAGVIGAVRSAAKELAPRNIRVNAVCPGFIDTRMTEALPTDVHEERISQIGMGRIGSAEDIASVIGFLVSDDSAYVTGQVVGVDGGMVI